MKKFFIALGMAFAIVISVSDGHEIHSYHNF